MKHLPFSTGTKSCYYNNMTPISRFLKEKFMALHVLIFSSSSNIQPCVNLFFFNYFLFLFHLVSSFELHLLFSFFCLDSSQQICFFYFRPPLCLYGYTML